jgi:hypothetical protein
MLSFTYEQLSLIGAQDFRLLCSIAADSLHSVNSSIANIFIPTENKHAYLLKKLLPSKRNTKYGMTKEKNNLINC